MDMEFDGKPARTHYGLELQSCTITAPKRKRYPVSVPAGDGEIDLTEGEFSPKYEMRTVTAVFRPVYGRAKQIAESLTNKLEGKRINLTLPGDPQHYMVGSVHVASADLTNNEITITVNCLPWRYAVEEAVHQIQASDVEVPYVFTNLGTREAVPTVKASGEILIVIGETSIAVSPGFYQMTELTIPGNGSISLKISGGPAELRYREAVL